MTSPTIFTIQTTEVYPDGQRKYLQIEADHESLDDLADDLRSGPVVVTHLITERTQERDMLRIVKRRDIMITAGVIYSAYVNDVKRFVESEEVGR